MVVHIQAAPVQSGPETRPFVTSKTARIYHDLFRVGRCKRDYELGEIIVHVTVCGKEYPEFKMNDLVPRETQERCSVCKYRAEERIRRAIEQAEREIRRPQDETSHHATFIQAMEKAELILEAGGAIVEFDLESGAYKRLSGHDDKRGYRLNLTWLTAEQVEVYRDDEELKQLRAEAMKRRAS